MGRSGTDDASVLMFRELRTTLSATISRNKAIQTSAKITEVRAL
jgi:hypothetical protein